MMELVAMAQHVNRHHAWHLHGIFIGSTIFGTTAGKGSSLGPLC